MKIAIIECVAKSNCQDAHVRQAYFIKDILKKEGNECEIIFLNEVSKYKNQKFDIIIKSYSTFYEDYQNENELYKNNKDAAFYFITNEYTIQTSGLFSKSGFKNITNKNIIVNFDMEKIKSNYWQNKYFVNLNALFYQPKQKQEKKYNICYYGTYRKDRRKSFQKYFESKDFILSTSPKSVKKFLKDGCKFTPCKRFIWGKNKDTLGLFRYTLYIEDEWIHANFHNLADRFYEAISNEVVVLFDESCKHTLEHSELKNIDYSKFLIDSYKQTINRNYEEDLKAQKEWIDILMKEKQNTEYNIKSIILKQEKKTNE